MDTNNTIAGESLAERIKRLRIASGLTQGQLGTFIGVSSTAVGNWESGEIPRGRHLPKLAEALSINLGDLLETTRSVDDLAEEVQLLIAFRSLPKERQLMAIKVVEALK